MNKNIMELKTSEEKKILLSIIERRISTLSEKTEDYFEKQITVSSKHIRDAFTNNSDLISILEQNDGLVTEMQEESFAIREKHQANFTKEMVLEVSTEIDNISIIQNTLDYKGDFIDGNTKMNALTARVNYLNNRNSRRKEEMDVQLSELREQIEENNLLDIKPMKEDVELIEKYIDRKDINKSKLLLMIPGIIIALSAFVMIGGTIWTIMI